MELPKRVTISNLTMPEEPLAFKELLVMKANTPSLIMEAHAPKRQSTPPPPRPGMR